MTSVRPATPADYAAIRRINLAAFPTPAEADLVDALRADGDLLVEWIAEQDGRLVGSIQFSRLLLEAEPSVDAAALAPVAVTPGHQGAGVGAALIRAGIEACRDLGLCAIIVLGRPGYYPRFGFSTEAARHVHDPFDAGDAFMAMALKTGVLERPLQPRYARAFGV